MRDDPSFQPQTAALVDGLQTAPGALGAAGGPAAPDVHRFYLWLFAAFLAHGAILTGFISSKPRQIGDPSGLDGAISISLITEADLRGGATVADSAPGNPAPPPALPAPPPQPPAAEAPEPNQQPPLPDPPRETGQAAQPAQPEPFMKPAIAPEAVNVPRETLPESGPGEPQPAETPRAEPTPPKAAEPQTENKRKTEPSEAKPSEAKPSTKPPPAKPKESKTAKLDMTPPPQAMQSAIPGGRGAGVERPAGITRSGENDMFARNVIRALQQTMPQLRDTRGRVKVRITLDKNGNLVSTQVLMPSNVPGLDQSVVFATRQTSFPLPPYKAVPADLVFVVTYIYK